MLDVLSRLLQSRHSLPSAELSKLESETRAALPEPIELELSQMDVLEWAPAWLIPIERLMLFALVCGLRPARYLEVGTFRGGSTLIVAAAMKASRNPGRLFCVEPEPHIAPEHWALVDDRATLIQGFSPEALAEARELAGGPFDFTFIDGDHTSDGVYRDATGALPYIAVGGHILFHDSYFPDVAEGITRFYRENSRELIDIGSITHEAAVQEGSDSLRWGGLRLMRVIR